MFKKFLRRENIFLFTIFLLALILRLVNLSTLPFYLHHDEIINTYAGRFILQNGLDLYGNVWPIFYFDKFGDYPPVLPMYLSGLATYAFGINAFAARFPSALLGALLVFPTFFLVKNLFKNQTIAYLSAFFIAVVPWTVVLSRASNEAIIGLFVFLSGFAFLISGLDTKNKFKIVISGIILILSYLFYPSFRILTPLVLLPLPFIYGKNLRKPIIILVVISVLVTGLVATSAWGKGRFEQTSIFSNPEVNSRIEALITDEGSNSILTARIFHNKLFVFSEEFITQYLTYFSPGFLFLSGGIPFEQVVPDTGVIYISFILLFLALLYLKSEFRNTKFNYLIYLLLIAPIPAALTRDFVPNVYRSLFLVVPLVILAALGASAIFSNVKRSNKKKLFLLFFALIFIYELVTFWHQYARHTASYKATFRDGGSGELTHYILGIQEKYEKIYLPSDGGLPLYYLFTKKDFSKNYAASFEKNLKIKKIGSIAFLGDECPSEVLKGKVLTKALVVDFGNCSVPESFSEIKSIIRADSTKAYRILVQKE